MTDPFTDYVRGWNAVQTSEGWVIVEPLVAGAAGGAANGLPAGLPDRLVVLTAANPGGVVLSERENAERNKRLVDRVGGLEPFPHQAPRMYSTVGGLPRGDSLSAWEYREDGVALCISRDEAALLAAEFGQLAYYSFEGRSRLLIGTADEGVIAEQSYRILHA